MSTAERSVFLDRRFLLQLPAVGYRISTTERSVFLDQRFLSQLPAVGYRGPENRGLLSRESKATGDSPPPSFFFLKPGVGMITASHASPTARDSVFGGIIYAYRFIQLCFPRSFQTSRGCNWNTDSALN